MIAFLTICYAAVIWVVFFKLKLLRWDRKAQVLVVTVGTVAIFLLLVAMNLFQPQAVNATVSQRVVAIVPRVQGRVIEVPIKPNAPIKKDDVLFRIDPRPYQDSVNQLEAALAQAEQAVPQLKAAWDQAVAAREQAVAEQDLADVDYNMTLKTFERQAATEIELDRARARRDAAAAAVRRAQAAEQQARLVYESEIGGVNTTVAQTRAQLDLAKFYLEECTVYAPADGFVTQLFLVPGAVTSTFEGASVMSFVYSEELKILANFRTNAFRHMRAGDSAEVLFDTIPGLIFNAEVVDIVPATGSGALTPGGSLLTTEEWSGSDLVAVRIQLTDDGPDRQVPVGTPCTVAVYAEGAKPIRVVRKVMLRMQAWIAYL
ncbi:MAG: HlyD family secretion protein [Planctomycetota bacterium]|jgi:multidrug resistance efflux pump